MNSVAMDLGSRYEYLVLLLIRDSLLSFRLTNAPIFPKNNLQILRILLTLQCPAKCKIAQYFIKELIQWNSLDWRARI